MWLTIAAFAVSVLAALIAITCAASARRCWEASQLALSRASTTSLRAELDEIRDAFEKNSALLKRINSRTVMQERREASSSGAAPDDLRQRPNESSAEWKARVRPQLIRAGQPAKHG